MQAAEAAAADKNYNLGLGSAHTRTCLPRKVHYALPVPLVLTPLSPPICINVLRGQGDNLVDRVILIARYLEARRYSECRECLVDGVSATQISEAFNTRWLRFIALSGNAAQARWAKPNRTDKR